MSLNARLAEVRRAQADCSVCRQQTAQAWQNLKQEGALAATPGRVLAAGLVTGFVAGFGGSRKSEGSPVVGKLVGMLMDGVFANLGAAIAAGAAAAAAEEGIAHHESSTTADGTER